MVVISGQLNIKENVDNQASLITYPILCEFHIDSCSHFGCYYLLMHEMGG